MTREEAIRIFEEWAKCNYKPTREAAQLAIAALTPPTQEQMERVWPGCDKCINHAIQKIDATVKRYHYRDSCYVTKTEITVNYCPNCGRPLTPAALDETAKRLEAMNNGEND